jgi:diguanylate cyclase (GGDEF)-like protein
MQLSIAKLVTVLVVVLLAVTVITTGVGLLAVNTNHRALETRHEAEARDHADSVATAIGHQLRFYQGILQLIASKPEVANLLEFSDETDIFKWSLSVAQLLPGSFGTALADTRGVVIGNPMALRIGPACMADMEASVNGGSGRYPVLHTDVPGFEHFDLIAPVIGPEGRKAGTLFVSFRLDVLRELLVGMRHDGDRIVLRDAANREQLTVGDKKPPSDIGVFTAEVPGTSWRIEFSRPVTSTSMLLWELLIVDVFVLAAVAFVIVAVVRSTLDRFNIDMTRIHEALEQVLAGNYQPSAAPTAIKETGILLPDIEQLAVKIQQQRDELRQQTLSDPLTGVFNRRYFDLMLAHHHEQSGRQPAAVLAIIDIDDFKLVNDRYGHHAGDRVLQATAAFLQARIRTTDIVARLGGDEFALILNHMAIDKLDQWLADLCRHFDTGAEGRLEGLGPVCRLSIGATFIDTHQHATPLDAFNDADHLMYRVKQRSDEQHSAFAVLQTDNVRVLQAVPDRR